MLKPDATQLFAAACFALAILHTFSVKRLRHLACGYRNGSVGENFFHLLGEIEVVFGVWAAVFLAFIATTKGPQEAIHFIQSRDFTEPAFVFVIMAVCSTRPILDLASRLIEALSQLLPLKRPVAFYATGLVVGPLLGSFITEPAAMTVTALILLDKFYSKNISQKLMYATVGLLFVNVSIGGTLTPYAAPPVLMVAAKWKWDLAFMITHFGWKAALAILLSTVMVTVRYKKEISKTSWDKVSRNSRAQVPVWVSGLHVLFLALIVISAHYVAVFAGLFLLFLGLFTVTREYQLEEVKLREGLLVAFFLAGLVVLGAAQTWWLEPLITNLNALPLFLGSAALTAVTDNAALTYLGAQVPNLSEVSRYALVAGAVTGGGLTVIANAPNPAGYGILNSSFGKEGISPLLLFINAVPPTVIAALCFWFF